VSRSLNLKKTPQDDGSIAVSWVDVQDILMNDKQSLGIGLGGFALMLVGLFIGLATQVWLLSLLIVGAGLFLLYRMNKGENLIDRRVVFSADTVSFDGRQFATAGISRIEARIDEARMKYFQSKNITRNDVYEIMIWWEDKQKLRVGHSQWNSDTVALIRAELEEAYLATQKAAQQQDRAEKYGDQDSFGVPDY